MINTDPILLGASGVLSLVLAYLLSTKDSESGQRKDPSQPPNINFGFSTRSAVRTGQTTLLEYTPPRTGDGGQIPSITRLFNAAQPERCIASYSYDIRIHILNSGSFTRPGPVSDVSAKGSPMMARSSSAAPDIESSSTPPFISLNSHKMPRSAMRAVSAPPPPSTAFAKKQALAAPYPACPLESIPEDNAGSMPPEPTSLPTDGTGGHTRSPRHTNGTVLSSSRMNISVASASRPSVPMVSSSAPKPAVTPVSRDTCSSNRAKITTLVISRRITHKCALNKHLINVLPDGTRPETAYFMSSGDDELSTPPHQELVKRNLQRYDVYMHVTPSKRQFWIYLEDPVKQNRHWEAIELGYVRALDQRRLSLTREGKPSFVGDTWANRTINAGM